MCWLIYQVFIALLNFSRSSTTKYVSLDNDPCRIRPTLLDINHVELNHCPFMNTLENVMLLVICLQNYVFQVNQRWTVKVFDMITKINKVKTLVKHTSSDWNANSIVQHANQIINAIMVNIKASVKCIVRAKKGFDWNPNTCISKSSRYLKSIVCNKVIHVTDSVSTHATNTILANVTSTVLMNCYILHNFLLEFISLFIVTIISYHYSKHR